jgi:hypothetical protein
MLVKAEVLKLLHDTGVDDAIAIKTINLFADVQDTVMKSKDRMEQQFLASNGLIKTEETVTDAETEI